MDSETRIAEDTPIVIESGEGAGNDTEGLTKKEIVHNMKCCITLDAVWATGWQDFQMALNPLLLFLGASNQKIGFISSLQAMALFGIFISPWISRRFQLKKWYYYLSNIPYTAAIGIIGIAVVTSHSTGVSKPWLLTFITCTLVAHQFFAGFVSLPFQEYIAACIPTSHRGRYYGLSNSLGSGLSILSTAIGGYILLRVAEPMSYGYLALMTWLICQSGYTFALFAKERPHKIEEQPKAWSKEMLKAAWQNKPWLRLLLTFSLIGPLIAYNQNFITIYGRRVLHLNVANFAGYQLVTLITRMGAVVVAGFLVDKFGPKRILPIWTAGHIFSMVIILALPNLYGIYIQQIWNSLWQALFSTAFVVVFFSLPKAHDRPGHYTIQTMFQYITAALGPLFAGFAYDKFGYVNVFKGTIVVSLLVTPIIFWAVSGLKDGKAEVTT